MNCIRAVVFDYGKVLSLPLRSGALDRLRELCGSPSTDFETDYFRDRHHFDRGSLSLRDYWSGLAASENLPLSDSLLSKLLAVDAEGWMDYCHPLIEWASRIRDRGIPTAILSNMPQEHVDYIVGRTPWMRSFSPRVFSSEVGEIKPEPQIYRILLEKLAIPASEVLFLDDLHQNIATARTLGINAIQFLSLEELSSELVAFPELPPLSLS